MQLNLYIYVYIYIGILSGVPIKRDAAGASLAAKHNSYGWNAWMNIIL